MRNTPSMRGSYSLGSIAGIRIAFNWSVLVLLGLVLFILSQDGGVFDEAYPELDRNVHFVMAVVAAAMLFGSILAHELGHAVQARRDGMEIDGITLWALGGVASFRGGFPAAGAEFRIAIAGPVVSAVLAGVFIGLGFVPSLPVAVEGVASWVGLLNLFLLAFNLIPALPLDGGRVLQAAVWGWRGDLALATRVAGAMGRGFAFLMMGGGVVVFLLTGNLITGLWLILLGWFINGWARGEVASTLATARLQGMRVGDLMVSRPVTASPDETLSHLHQLVVWGPPYTSYPVVDRGVALGLLPAVCFHEVPKADWERRVVADCMVPRGELATFDPDDDALEALMRLQSTPLGRGLVMDGSNLVGLLSITDLALALRARAATASN